MKKYLEERPWGKFEQYAKNQSCTVKILFVKANEELSLQYHFKRQEFWKIIKGKAEITIGSKIIKAKENDEFFIPQKTKHRVKTKKEGVNILEISFGKFEEKDEVRLEDKYKRGLTKNV